MMRLRNGLLGVMVVLVLALAGRADTLRVRARAANLRATASTDSKIVATLPKGSALEVVEKVGAWYKVTSPDGVTGYVHSSVVEAAAATSERKEPAAPVPALEPSPVAEEPATPPASETIAKPAARVEPSRASGSPVRPSSPTMARQRSGSRLRFLGDVVVAPLSQKYTQTRSFQEYGETGVINADHEAKLGFGGSLGVEYAFSGSFGAVLTVSYVNRTVDTAYDASFPHPLYFDKQRTAEGTVDGLSYKEAAAHLDAAYLGKSGSIGFSIFAGPSFFNLSTDLVDSITYSQAYPFDTVTVSNVATTSESKTAVGFNVGAGLDYDMSEKLALGAQVRYSRAKVTFEGAAGDKTDVDAGGLQVFAGVRIRF